MHDATAEQEAYERLQAACPTPRPARQSNAYLARKRALASLTAALRLCRVGVGIIDSQHFRAPSALAAEHGKQAPQTGVIAATDSLLATHSSTARPSVPVGSHIISRHIDTQRHLRARRAAHHGPDFSVSLAQNRPGGSRDFCPICFQRMHLAY